MVTAQAATLLAWDAGSLLCSAAVAAFVAPYVPPGSRPAIGAQLCDSCKPRDKLGCYTNTDKPRTCRANRATEIALIKLQ